MRRWDGLLDRYVARLQVRGLSVATIDSRSRELTRFGAWLKARRPRLELEQVDADTIVRYIRTRSSFHARATVSGVVSELRCMGEFLVEEGIWPKNPLRWLRGPKLDVRRQIPKRIGQDELRAIWAAARGRRQEHARYQAVCVLAILYGTGLRRGELERLAVDDWDGEHRLLRVDGRKTGRQRHVPVGEGVWRCIEAYLPRRQNRLELTGRLDERALLVNTLGERVSAESISSMVRRLAEEAGVGKVTIHQFRHTCASDLLEAGVTLPEVQKILGHAVIASTVRYLSIADPERAAAISRHPINRFLAPDEGQKEAS
jgi:site-specific recombinase XerD